MPKIEFNREEKEILVTKLKDYLHEEIDIELGQFDVEFLLDFITKELGSTFYNKGLEDAQLVLARKLDEINEAIDAVRV